MTVSRNTSAEAKRRTLELLTAVADGLLVFELNGKYRHAFINEGLSGIRRISNSEQKAAYRRRYFELRRRKLLYEKRAGKKVIATLTARGMESLSKLKVRNASRRIDGKRIYVMYDVPERFRPARDAFRIWLKGAGFRKLQWSVWSSDRNVEEHVRKWIKMHELGRWVKIAVS